MSSRKCRYDLNRNIRNFEAYTLALYMLLYPQPFGEVFRFLLYMSISVYGIYILINFFKERNTYDWNTVSVSLLLFLAVHVVVTLIHGEIFKFGLHVMTLITFVLVGLIPRDMNAIDDEVKLVAKTASITGIIIVILSFIIPVLLKVFPSLYDLQIAGRPTRMVTMAYHGGRLTGYGTNPNPTGMMCMVGIIGSFLLLFKCKDRKSLIISIVGILSCGLLVVMTGSRASILSAGVFGIVMIATMFLFKISRRDGYTRKVFNTIIIIILAAIALFCFVIFVVPSIRDYLIDFIIRPSSLKTGSGRTEIYELIWDTFASKGYKTLSKGEIVGLLGWFHAHNTGLDILVTHGFLGFIFFFTARFAAGFYLVVMLSRHKRIDSETLITLNILFAAYVAAAVHGSFEGLYTYNWLPVTHLYLWVVLISSVIWNNERRLDESRDIQ